MVRSEKSSVDEEGDYGGGGGEEGMRGRRVGEVREERR